MRKNASCSTPGNRTFRAIQNQAMAFYLDQLTLTNFKNYEQQTISCSPRFNGFVGLNGMGKTNLLDAIYYLCMAKSNFWVPDSGLVRHEADFFRLEGRFTLGEKTERIVAKIQPRKKKVLERNGVPYEKLSEHIGLMPVVFMGPDDTLLISEGSDMRRRFLNNTLSQIDHHYLGQLIIYNRLLQQRNSLLKKWGEEGGYDPDLLQVYDQQMLDPARYIHEQRQAFTGRMVPAFQAMQQRISGQQEEVGLEYQSQLREKPLEAWWQEQADKDRYLQRTNAGIHKDDLKCTIRSYPLKKYASQGQLKSYVLALKLTQYQLLSDQTEEPPLMLLDDIFDKLDARRVGQLLELLIEESFGQVFITDTHEERIASIISNLNTTFRRFRIRHGEAEKLD